MPAIFSIFFKPALLILNQFCSKKTTILKTVRDLKVSHEYNDKKNMLSKNLNFLRVHMPV
jgi:hypothetical protein